MHYVWWVMVEGCSRKADESPRTWLCNSWKQSISMKGGWWCSGGQIIWWWIGKLMWGIWVRILIALYISWLIKKWQLNSKNSYLKFIDEVAFFICINLQNHLSVNPVKRVINFISTHWSSNKRIAWVLIIITASIIFTHKLRSKIYIKRIFIADSFIFRRCSKCCLFNNFKACITKRFIIFFVSIIYNSWN